MRSTDFNSVCNVATLLGIEQGTVYLSNLDSDAIEVVWDDGWDVQGFFCGANESVKIRGLLKSLVQHGVSKLSFSARISSYIEDCKLVRLWYYEEGSKEIQA